MGHSPIYIGSLFVRLDECVGSTVRSMARYDVVIKAATSFIQIFLWEQFEALFLSLFSFQQLRWRRGGEC